MQKKVILFLIFLFSAVGMVYSQQPTMAQQTLAKAINCITSAKGIVAKFSISNSGYSGTGEIKSLGNKFNVTLPDVEVWYNGNELYTYNKRTSETTVTLPTAEELAESNPLAYVTGSSKNYNVAISTVKKNGSDVLELTPKSKSEIKRITLTLRKSDSVPEKIVVEPQHGNPIRADINSFKTGVALSTADFEYPKSKLSKVEIIDLK